jgi:hypothetical protein
VDGLKKLRSGAKRNGVILTFFFFPLGEAQIAVGGAFRNRYAKLNLKIKKLPVMRFPSAHGIVILRWGKDRLYGLLLRSGGVFPLGSGKGKKAFFQGLFSGFWQPCEHLCKQYSFNLAITGW